MVLICQKKKTKTAKGIKNMIEKKKEDSRKNNKNQFKEHEIHL